MRAVLPSVNTDCPPHLGIYAQMRGGGKWGQGTSRKAHRESHQMNADRLNELRHRIQSTVVDFVKEGDFDAAVEFAEIDDAFEEALEIIESRWPETPPSIPKATRISGAPGYFVDEWSKGVA